MSDFWDEDEEPAIYHLFLFDEGICRVYHPRQNKEQRIHNLHDHRARTKTQPLPEHAREVQAARRREASHFYAE